MPRPRLGDSIAWRDWNAEAFAEAVEADRPLLLVLETAWCELCAHVAQVGYGDLEVVRIVAARFVPMRVDADRRPDVGERYGLGGWPSTLCLTPEGEVLDGAVLQTGPAIASFLREVADTFARRRSEIAVEAREATARRTAAQRAVTNGAAPPDAVSSVDWLERRLLAAFDPRHGGFGSSPKMPHFGVLRFALRRHLETGDESLRQVVTTSLDGMARRGLHDTLEGGLYRYAESADWACPHSEKLLEHNADGLELYLDAWRCLGRGGDREVAEGVARYAMRTLWSSEQRGFRNAQRADRRYHRLESARARAAACPPPVDPHVYAASNARMISALLALGRAVSDEAAVRRASDALEQMLLHVYRPGGGVAHVVAPPPGPGGLLVDQVRVAAAALDAHETTGDAVHLDLAQEIMLFALRAMRDDRSGGLLDRTPAGDGSDAGLLRDPVVPVDLNGEAAGVLLRLAAATERDEFARWARTVIDACRGRYRSYDLLAAPYVLAVAAADARGA